MAEIIMAYELDSRSGTLDPLRSIKNTITFSSRDWAKERDLAWLYGIVFGWTADEDDPDDSDPMPELQERFGWSGAEAVRLAELHRRFDALSITPEGGE